MPELDPVVAAFSGALEQRVVDVRDVLDVVHVMARVAPDPLEDVEGDVGRGMPQVGGVVRRDPADVEQRGRAGRTRYDRCRWRCRGCAAGGRGPGRAGSSGAGQASMDRQRSGLGCAAATVVAMRPTRLLAGLDAGASLRVGDDVLTGDALRAAVGGVAATVGGARRVAVWATPTLDTCVAVAGVITAGATAIPLDPRAAPAELAHVVTDSHPDLVLAAPGQMLPPPVGGLPRGGSRATPADLPPEPGRRDACARHVHVRDDRPTERRRHPA